MGNLVFTFRQKSARQLAGQAVDPGTLWMFFGDSQTAGRWTSGTNTVNHGAAFKAIWDNKYPGNTVTVYSNGVSGRDLPTTITAYNDRTTGTPNKSTATMVWVQESGNINFTGQSTTAAFKTTFKDFWRTVNTNTPNAVKLYETAFSFGRGPAPIVPAEDNRDWTDWNTALREAVTELAGEGITVRIIETDAAIKALQQLTPATEVWFERGHASGNEFHYRGLGNAMVAVAGFDALNISLTLADLSGLNDVSNAEAQLLLDVKAGL